MRPNELAELLSLKKSEGKAILDLTLSNPTRAGFRYPHDRIAAALAEASLSVYEPDPRGAPQAREAVSGYYCERGMNVSPDDVIITASTSEAYSFLFRILADPGEKIVIPRPGYPLFEYLLRLDGLQALSCSMRYSQGWWYDFDSACFDDGVKAVIIVSPGNPAGNYIHEDEWELITGKCGQNGIPLVYDEVFYDFPLGEAIRDVDPVEETDALTFVLNGFSKTAGLPQLKMSWIVVRGPREQKEEALRKLEFISDVFLSPSTAVQGASGKIFRLAPEIRSQIQSRIRDNLDFLLNAVKGSSSDCLEIEGGWSAVVRLPGTMECCDWARLLLEHQNILAHPGSFYGMEGGPYLVLSLLPEADDFREGVIRMLEEVSRRVRS